MKIATKTRAALVLLWALYTPLACVAEDSALYWAVSQNGEPAGYLLGTIHSEDPRVLDFSDTFIEQLTANRFFAMEMVPDLPTLARLTDYMHYQDGSTLESRIGPERYAQLQEALADYRLPADWVGRMKVWAAMMTLSMPPPESGLFMDFSLSLRASGSGMKVVGLETLEEQLSFLENMPADQQIELLDHALQEYSQVSLVHRQMVERYLDGDLAELAQFAEQQMSELRPESRDYFMEQGIDVRNRRMLAALLPHLEQGRVFIAVGSLHLPGERGLIALLRAQGFELSPLPLPFMQAD